MSPARNLGKWVAIATVALAGCDDLGEFKTGRGTVFRGDVVGSDSARSDGAPEESSFIRKGFLSHTRMELEFDPYATGLQADSDRAAAAAPGRVHTYVCPAKRSACSAADGASGPFDHARLEPIENLTHDSLSEYTFPGGGRLRNYIFGVRFESPPSQPPQPTGEADAAPILRNAMVFLSLMENGKIEVRAISPSVLAPDGESEHLPALFGVFVLDRQSK